MRNIYSKTSKSLQQYYKDKPNDKSEHESNYELFISKVKITGCTPAGSNTKEVKIIVRLKYLSNF